MTNVCQAAQSRRWWLRVIASTFLLRVLGIVLAFVATIIFARQLGPEEYGRYALVFSWATVAMVLAGLGLPDYLVREAAREQSPRAGAGLLRWADPRLLIASLVAGVLLLALGAAFVPGTGMVPLLLLAAPLPLLGSLAAVRQSILRARRRIAASLWPQLLVTPAASIAGLYLAALWLGWSASALMAASLATALLVLALTRLQVGATSPRPGTEGRSLGVALPFALISILSMINGRADQLIVGALLGATEAGIYTVAMRSAQFVSFPLLVANTIIAPILAAAHQNGDRGKMERLLRISSRLTLLVAMPIGLVPILFGSELLGLVFGPSFSAGAPVLAILAGAQVLNVAFGSVALVLKMCNLEWLVAVGIGLAAMLNIALNIALIPRLGIEGAALASLISLVSWNALLWGWVRGRLNVTASAVGG